MTDKRYREAKREIERQGIKVLSIENTGGTHKRFVTDHGTLTLPSSARGGDAAMRRRAAKWAKEVKA